MTDKIMKTLRDALITVAVFCIADAIISFWRWLLKSSFKFIWKVVRRK